MRDSAERDLPLTQSALSGRFFHHALGRPAGRPSNPTRYLCAAAYLNPWYANRVIGELVASHRAVAPSVDIDLAPIIGYCLHARRIALVRDIVLTILLAAGLALAFLPTIAVLIIAFGLAFLRGPAWQRRSVGAKVGIAAGVTVALVGAAVLIAVISLLSRLTGTAAPGLLAGIGRNLAALIAFLGLTATTVIFHTSVKFRTLSERLRPEAAPTRFSPSTSQVESRISQVQAAQWGNVTLYQGENPFIGTGKVNRAWSIAIELDRARPPGPQPPLTPPSPRRYAPIDPVELHQVIRERLLRLNDPALPENERIAALTVEDHIVGEGLRRWDGPLIDAAQKMPYSQAGPEAIQALIRHPQAGLRYYQRVSVSDRGQAVLSNGQEVIGGADQEVAVSAFVYAAVEGRMFYLELVTTVLPPIQRRYHIIDRLPRTSSGAFLAKVILEAATTMFGDLISAPARLYRTWRVIRHEQGSFADEAASYGDYLFGDVGARCSVRELGAADSPHTYIQTLDVAKYTKIIERLLTDTVLDFLRDKGVDTTAYASSAASVVNAAVINYGNMAGPVAADLSGPVTQTVQQQP
jgi:hypothetical protein